MQISEDTKNRIIELFFQCNKRINTILKEVAPNGEITVEDIYNVLNDYKAKNPEKAVKKERLVSLSKISDEEILKLREQGLSYSNMVDYFKEKGIKVSYSAINKRCIFINNKIGKDKQDLGKSEKSILPEDEIILLREEGLSYKKIAEYFTKKGIKVCESTINERCKKIYSKLGKNEQDLRKVNISDDEIIELRKRGLSFKDIAEYYNAKGIYVTAPTIGIRCKKMYYKIEDLEPKKSKGLKFSESIDDDIFMLKMRWSII